MAQAESTRIGGTPHAENKLTTTEMVDVALEELDAPKREGVTLQGIKKFISTKFSVAITKQRKNYIGNYLRDLLAAGDMINVTGRGLVGHLRLVTKNKRKPQLKLPLPRNVQKKRVRGPHKAIEKPQEHVTGQQHRGLFSLSPSENEDELPEISAPVRLKPTHAMNSRGLDETPLSSRTRKRRASASGGSRETSNDSSQGMISSRLRSKDNISELEKPSKRRLYNPQN